MSVWQILLSFDGRLNRKPYWIAGLLLMLAAIAVAAIVSGVVYVINRPVTQREFMRAVFPWLMPFTFILAYPLAAITAKRLRDRNKPGWLAGLLVVPMLVESWVDPAFSGGEPQSQPIYLIYVATATATWVVGIWFFIELGFLRGSRGENRYGSDPLAPMQTVLGVG